MVSYDIVRLWSSHDLPSDTATEREEAHQLNVNPTTASIAVQLPTTAQYINHLSKACSLSSVEGGRERAL